MAQHTSALDGSIRLSRINAAPAQTWNWLRANSIDVLLPARNWAGIMRFGLPRTFDSLEVALGQEANSWFAHTARDARYIEVPAHTTRPEPIVIDIDSAKNDIAETGVMVREGASVTIFIAAHGTPEAEQSASDADNTAAHQLKIIARADAHVEIVEILGASDTQQVLDSLAIQAEKNAHIELRQYILGAKQTVVGTAVDLIGDNARLDLNCRYFGHNTQTIDINHIVRMRGKNTRAELAEGGVLDDAAKKSLRATIDLINGAGGAQGNESENVLVLGDDVVNKTMPTILCDEDSVQGNHGAAIGSASPEQLRYLEKRGLTRAEAEQLFVRALFEDAILHVPAGQVRDAAIERAEVVLGKDIAHELAESLEEA